MTTSTPFLARGRTGRDLTLALLPGTAFMLVFALRAFRFESQWRFTLFDDALISMAYGRTFAATGEWVWFPGAERVQGITNPLWSAIMAAIHLPASSPSMAIVAVTVVSALLLLATAVTLFFAVAFVGAPRIYGLAAAGAVPFLYPLTFWSLRGMEVGLVALLTSVLILAAVRARSVDGAQRTGWFVIAAIAGVGAVATRLDALVIVVVVAVLALVTGGPTVRRGWWFLLVVTAATAAVFVFQWW